MKTRAAAALCVLAGLIVAPAAPSQGRGGPSQGTPATSEQFELTFGDVGITELRHRQDAHSTQYIRRGRPLGEVVVHYRPVGAPFWSEALTRDMEFVEAASPTSLGGEGAPAETVAVRELVWEIRPGLGRRPESIEADDIRLRCHRLVCHADLP